MKLYEIRHEIETALLTPEDEHFNPQRIEELNMVFDDKVESCVAVIKNLKSDADQIDAEIKRLQARKAAVENNRKGLSEYIKAEMERLGKDKVKAGVHQARIANSPVSAIITDADRVSLEFKETHTETRIDKKAIIQHFKETGEILKGVEMKQATHLRVS